MTIPTSHDAGHVGLRRSLISGTVYSQEQHVTSYLFLLRFVPLELGFMKLVLRPLSPFLLSKLVCT